MDGDHWLAPEAAADLDALVRSFLDAHAAQPPGIVSVWFGDTAGRAAYTRDQHEPHYAASTMKLPLLVAAYRRAGRGELDLDIGVPVHNRFRSAADGSAFGLDRADDQDDDTWDGLGTSVALRELVRRAGVRSGNLATNLVLERVGPAEMAAVLADAGCTPATVLLRGIEDAAARRAGLDNRVTASDLALVLGGVARRTLAAKAVCEQVEAVLAAQEHRNLIPAGLPAGTYVANKTGWVDGVCHDAALVRPADAAPYVLVVCTTVDVPEAVAADLVARVSGRVWRERRS